MQLERVSAYHTRFCITVATACLLLAGLEPVQAGAHAAQAEAPPEPATMTAEQKALAKKMEAFRAATERRFFDVIEELNGALDIETRRFDYEEATHTVKVARGPVAEKAGWYVNVQKKAKPPFVPEALYSRYMEIDVHAATPHVGMLHATIYFTILKNGRGMLAGYMDYVPAVVHEEDNRQLEKIVTDAFAAHDTDIEPFRHELCESEFGAEHHRDRLQAACVGVSLYARPMLEVNARNLDLVTDTFTAFTDGYFEILRARQDQPYTSADTAKLDAMRKRWFEDQMFADTFARKVVPYEVWSMANLPPEVKF